MPLIEEDEIEETFLTIQELPDRKLVTAIEVLSPTNKKTRDARAEYLEKRRNLIAAGVNFVEIDLLRSGEPMPVRNSPPRGDYRILICRPRLRRTSDLYNFSYTMRIPDIPIPLLPGDAEPSLKLTDVLHALIDRARYDLSIDYHVRQTLRYDPKTSRGQPQSSLKPRIKRQNRPRGEHRELPGSSLSQCRSAQVSRRWFFEQCGVGLGLAALAQLFQDEGYAASPANPASVNPLAVKAPHHAAKAKRVLFLFMAGAPAISSFFDNKPQLAKFDGTLPPADLIKGYRAAFIKPSSKLLGPKFKFARHGQSGTELSELLPHLATVVDDIAVVKGMVTDAFNHAPGQIMMNTGSQIFGRPSLGAWVGYGLGSESQDLPGFVVFSTGKKGPSGGNSNWGNGFLPTVYQGVQFRTSGDPVLYLSNPRGVDPELQRESFEAVNKLNRLRLSDVGIPRSRPESTRTKWRTACNSRRPMWWTSAMSLSTFLTCTESNRANRRSRVHASWRAAAGARSAVCADLPRVVGSAQRSYSRHQTQ